MKEFGGARIGRAGAPGPDGGPGNGAGLTRAIRLPHATALVIGTIIGASIFVQPSEIVARMPTTAGVYAVWIVSGVLTVCGALVCAELASAYPRSGGVYVFLRESFGPWLGFLWGWAMFWTMHSGIIAAIAMVFAQYTAFAFPMGGAGLRVVAVAVILVLSGINLIGVRQGSTLQALFTAGKLVAIAVMIVVGFALGPSADAVAGGAAGGVAGESGGSALTGMAGVRTFALALVAGLFAFGGWHMVTYSAGETVDAARTIPRALLAGTLVVTACYIALNAVYMHVLPREAVAASMRIAADAADAVLGRGGGAFMAGLVLFSTFGALSGIILAGPRVYYAMAGDGLLFGWLSGVHARFRTPHRAIVLQAVWSSVLVLTGTYRALFTRVIYTEWIFFGLLAIGLVLLRRRGSAPSYRVWGYPVVPIVFALAAFGIVLNQVVTDPRESAAGLGFVIAGLPVYLLWGRNGRR
ncbi:MAG: amino acid permease [Gemmatimonadetes bacterium]|nr:amino acid permease [Gemmatimonadota bacterium]